MQAAAQTVRADPGAPRQALHCASSASHTWIARDGTAVAIRQIRQADFDLEEEFVHGLSASTAYQRLMSARKPSQEELRRWTDVDHDREMALVATVTVGGRERQIGVARYVVESSPREAEFAIVLSDEWQRRGLGRELLSSLLVTAKSAGLRRLVGTTLSQNKGMLELARGLGFRLARAPGSAIITMLTVDLDGL
jgi:RimJ/RimL family protein N-acetyltransferase